MLTIGQFGRRFGLSRSTLLYYDRIGLLSPSVRSAAGYRLYSRPDVERMERIDVYRQAGLPLSDIKRVLSSGGTALEGLLVARLRSIDEKIRSSRHQQRLIVKLLRNRAVAKKARSLDKEGWVSILRAAGLSDDDMHRWHVEFERLSPGAHQDFLESLGIAQDEIGRIREWSKQLGRSTG